jgi:hypothetical protein
MLPHLGKPLDNMLLCQDYSFFKRLSTLSKLHYLLRWTILRSGNISKLRRQRAKPLIRRRKSESENDQESASRHLKNTNEKESEPSSATNKRHSYTCGGCRRSNFSEGFRIIWDRGWELELVNHCILLETAQTDPTWASYDMYADL